MTCIVGIVNEETVYIGADRGASDGDSVISIKNPKVESRNGWVYGYAGTIGIGQLLSYTPLDDEVEDVFTYIRHNIVNDLKEQIKTLSNDQEEHDTAWLIGKNGRLFELSAQDWGVVEVDECSIGSGNTYAFGSLYTSIDKDPVERIGLALGAAIHYSISCVGPIDILLA